MLPYYIILAAWAIIGAVQWLRYSDEVRRQPQILVFALMCGPLIWFCHCFGWAMDILHWISLGFRQWLFKP